MRAVRAPLIRALSELTLAGVAGVGGAVSWLQVRYLVLVAPVIDSEPATSSVNYHPRMLLLALVLTTAAGVLLVVGTARFRRARRGPETGYPAGGLSPG